VLRFPAGVHGIRRATVINSDVVRAAAFAERRRAERGAQLDAHRAAVDAARGRRAARDPQREEIATVIEDLGRKGLQIQRYRTRKGTWCTSMG
jgi:hypothetical protein